MAASRRGLSFVFGRPPSLRGHVDKSGRAAPWLIRATGVVTAGYIGGTLFRDRREKKRESTLRPAAFSDVYARARTMAFYLSFCYIIKLARNAKKRFTFINIYSTLIGTTVIGDWKLCRLILTFWRNHCPRFWPPDTHVVLIISKKKKTKINDTGIEGIAPADKIVQLGKNSWDVYIYD